eukprot:PITA_23577
MTDIPITKTQLTWRDNRIGEDSLPLRLNRFLIMEGLLNQGLVHRQWVGSGGISNHLPIYMEISGGRTPPTTTGHIVEGFAQNLNELKRLSKIWAQNKRRRDDQTLREVEIEIVDFESNLGGLYNSNEHKDRISSQYADRGEILKDSEESWRLRSRAIWMLEGDDNTKFYHKFANGRKAINTIWELPNEQGHPLNTFPQLAALASSHFKQIYRAPP